MEKLSKYAISGASVLFALMVTGCSEKENEPNNIIADAEGKEVNFSIALPDQSRTYYDPEAWWDESKNVTEIFWGDITNPQASEKVAIYGDFAGRNKAAYTVGGYATGSNTASTLVKIGETGVQWGSESQEPVHFYSVYPYVNDTYLNASLEQGWLQTELTPGQSAQSYSLVTDGSTSEIIPEGNYKKVLEMNSVPSSVRTFVANPDMSAAVMIADTTAAWGATTVPLSYKMLPDVIEITISGPAQGFMNGNNEVTYLDILGVTVTHKNGTPIAGRFNYNPKTKDIVVTSQDAKIQMGMSVVDSKGVVSHPRLYRVGNNVDRLKVRMFILPGINPQDLLINVDTSLGYYQLGEESMNQLPSSFQTGKIHRLKLPLFDSEGLHQFNYSNWMEQINPKVYITELSIPGSWMSFSLVPNADESTTVSTTAQGYQVTDYQDQYKKGIRAFSLRVYGKKLSGTNYVMDTSENPEYVFVDETTTKFDEVLNYLGSQIDGKKEFVVLQIRGIGIDPNGSFKPAQFTINPIALQNVLLNNKYVYQDEINAKTTMEQVMGHIIVKINADKDYNVPSTWPIPSGQNPFPGLISQWGVGTNAKALTSSLDWGALVNYSSTDDTFTTGVGNTGLYWCFSECDNVSSSGSSEYTATVAERKEALDSYIEESIKQYNRREHDTWFYYLAGGQWGENNTFNPEHLGANVAINMNQIVYSKLSNPSRTACPMGIVMMNYASSINPIYNSANLIRVIINNNNAFIMAKQDDGQEAASNDAVMKNKGDLVR